MNLTHGRHEAFSPLFQKLHDNSVVYREHAFYVIASLSELEIGLLRLRA